MSSIRLSSLAELIWFSSATVLLVNPFMDFCIVSPWMVSECITSEVFFFPSHLVELVPLFFFLYPKYVLESFLSASFFENLFNVLAGMTFEEDSHAMNTFIESSVYSS